MSRFYENLFKTHLRNGFFVLSLLIAFLLLGTVQSFAQTFANDGPVCEGGSLTLTFTKGSCTGTISDVQITGPNSFDEFATESGGVYTVTIDPVTTSAAGIYTANILWDGGNGTCNPGPFNTTVTVNPLPQGSLTANGICVTGTGQLTWTASAGSGPFTVIYNDGTADRTVSGVGSGTAFDVFDNPVTSNTTYTLVSVADANCTRSSGFTGGSATITVNPLPQGSLTANGSFCGTGAGQLTWTATVGTGPYTVIYNDGTADRTASGVVSGTAFDVFTTPVTSNTTYTLVSVANATCTRSSGFTGGSATITVNPLPQGSLTANGSFCGTGAGQLTWTAIDGTGPFTVIYNDGTADRTVSGVVSGTAFDVFTTPVTSNTTYTLVSVADANCSRSSGFTGSSATITVNPLPAINLTVGGTGFICSGTSSNISVASSVVGINYQLRDGVTNIGAAKPGTGSTLYFPTGILTTATTFNILATNATTTCSAQLTQTATVSINPLPADPANPTATTPGCGTVVLTRVDPAVAGTAYYWQTSASGTSTANGGETYTVSTSGTYYIRSYYTATGCWSSGAGSLAVTVVPIPNISLGSTPSICTSSSSQSVAFSYTNPQGSPTHYVIDWNAAANTAGLSDVPMTALPASPIYVTAPANIPNGVYSGTITISNASICSSSSSIQLIVNTVPAAATLTGSQSNCVGDVTQYTITNPQTGNYSWSICPQGTIISGGDGTSVWVRWNTEILSNGGWIRASIRNSCGETPGNFYYLTVTEIPADFNFTYAVSPFPYPSLDDASNAYYCKEGNGVTLTVSGQEPDVLYTLRRKSGLVTMQTHQGTGTAAFDFTGVKVEDSLGVTASSTLYEVIAQANSNSLCATIIGEVTVHKFVAVDSGAIATTFVTPTCITTTPGPVFTSSRDASGGDGTDLDYQWQYKLDAGSWTDIGSATSASYSSPALTTAGTYVFRRQVTTFCATLYSNEITITVRPQFTPGAILTTNETICYNGNPGVIGSATAASGGDGTITYKWQSSLIGDFTDAVDLGSSDAATYDPASGLTATTTYRRLAHDGTCNTTFEASTGTWVVTVIPNPTVTIPDANADTCGLVYKFYGNSITGGPGSWAKFTGTGGAVFTDATSINTTVTVTLIGDYVFKYTITDSPCASVTGTMNVTFKAVPTALTLETALTGCAGVQKTYTLDTPFPSGTLVWSVIPGDITPGGGSIVGSSTGTSVDINWTSGFAYRTDTLQVIESNGTCSTTTKFPIAITPKINPATTISGNDTVFAYKTGESYSVTNIAGNTYSWSVTEGTIIGSTTGSSITVDWGPGPYPALTPQGKVTVTISNSCDNATFDTTVVILPNLLAGQVKYWNATESPMPSPFMTNYNGMDVPDYFYVTLLERDADVFVAVDTVMVQAEYFEVAPNVFEDCYSYFKFDYNLDPAMDYKVEVWDGGYLNEGGTLFGFLGQTWTWNNWAGVNATDALFVQHMAAGINITIPDYATNGVYWIDYSAGPPTSYGSFANKLANVNNSANGTTALDALLINRRVVGYMATFPSNKPNFEVVGKRVDVDDFNNAHTFAATNVLAPDKQLPNIPFVKGTVQNYTWSTDPFEHKYLSDEIGTIVPGDLYLNIYYSAVGDINASYVPQYGISKDAPVIELNYNEVLVANVGEEVTIPVSIDRAADLGALSLGITYRNDLIEVVGTNYGEDFARFDNQTGTLKISWSSLDGVSFNADDDILYIKVRVLANIDAGTRFFELNSFTELADVNAEVIEGVNFKTLAISTDATQTIGSLTTSNSPNPFNNQTIISYTLPEAGNVNLVVYNKMGQVVKTFVNEYQTAGVHQVTVLSTDLFGPGVYVYRLEVKGETKEYSSTNSIILIR